MNSSFYNGISGITTHQFGIDVWANNISNINTIGYKANIPEFSTLFSTAMQDSYFDATMNDKSYGSRPSSTAINTNQGSIRGTDNVFDLALSGEGWFGVQNRNSETLYTRAGSFSIDAKGDMVDTNGNYLLGTLGGNITTTTLSNGILEDFGKYYKKNIRSSGEPKEISSVDSIPLSGVNSQTKINLPDLLYYPPKATTSAVFSANLNPAIEISTTQIEINDLDINSTVDVLTKKLNIAGDIVNTTNVQDPKPSQVVLVEIVDFEGKKVDARAKLDNNLKWTVFDEDISLLNTTKPLKITAKLLTTQEIPNKEHFSSSIIAPSGEKGILDMTYTKRVPATKLGSTWDGVIQVLNIYEKYDENKTYDTNLYKVDKSGGKVYEIIDQKNAVVEFASNGALLSETIPTMSNGGIPLDIDIGKPGSFSGFSSGETFAKERLESHDGYLFGLLKAYGMDGQGNVCSRI